MDDHGREIRIEHGGAECILETANKHRLVNEGVQRTAQPAPLGAKRRPARSRRSGDDQDLEIGPVRDRCGREPAASRPARLPSVPVGIPVAGMLAERPRQQCAGDAFGKRERRPRVVFRGILSQRSYQMRSGISMKFLGNRHLGERGLEFGAIARAIRPGLRRIHQIPPLVARAPGPEKN